MIIYNYNKTTKEYINFSEARLDPEETKLLGEDVYLIPSNATVKIPPETVEHQIAVFDGSSWNVISDYRGTIYWLADGTEHVITNIGEEIPVGGLLEQPPPLPKTPEELIAEKIAGLKEELKEALVWQFKMLSVIWETGVNKALWSGADIIDIELRNKYLYWRDVILPRLDELGE